MNTIKVSDFEVIHFTSTSDEGKTTPVILLYALGFNGVVYELSGGKWTALPITEDRLREMPITPKQ